MHSPRLSTCEERPGGPSLNVKELLYGRIDDDRLVSGVGPYLIDDVLEFQPRTTQT